MIASCGGSTLAGHQVPPKPLYRSTSSKEWGENTMEKLTGQDKDRDKK